MRYPYARRVSAGMRRNERKWERTVGQFATPLMRHTRVPSAHSAGCVHEARYTAAEMNVLRNGGEPARWPRQCFAPPCTEDRTVRAAVTRSAQQELPGSWPGHPQARRCCVVSRCANASGAGRVATAGGKAAQAVIAGTGLREAQSGPCRSRVDSRNASLPCVGLIGWNR